MLNKKHRLPKGRRTWDKQLSNSLFILKISNNGLEYNRVGIIVSKKVDKRAVLRNRLKRIVGLCIRTLNKEIKEGFDLLFIMKKEALGQKESDFCSLLKYTLRKEEIIQ